MNLKNLKCLLDDHQTGMSDFQDDYLVTAKSGGTIYGQYKQSLRELYKRFRGLRELIYGENGRKFLDIEIRRLKEKLQGEKYLDSFEREELEIKLKHKCLIAEEANRAIYDTHREFTRFYQQAELLKEKVGELTSIRRRELETEMWIYRIKEMAALDFLQFSRLQKRTIEFISVLPKDKRQDIYDLVFNEKNHEKLISDYINRENIYELSFEEIEIKEIEIKKIENLIEYKDDKYV